MEVQLSITRKNYQKNEFHAHLCVALGKLFSARLRPIHLKISEDPKKKKFLASTYHPLPVIVGQNLRGTDKGPVQGVEDDAEVL